MGPYTLFVLNLDHPEIEAAIIKEIESGVDVYYDRRWEITKDFCQFLIEQPHWVEDRSVLVLGAGIGMETLIIGRLCRKIYLNDRAPVALELCARQLERNGIDRFEVIPGRYEAIPVPPIDIVAGCNIVYNPDTSAAMKRFLNQHNGPVLLMNEPMPGFTKLVKTTTRKTRFVLREDTHSCVLLE
jgi:predicted nicotinamide N-methyase